MCGVVGVVGGVLDVERALDAISHRGPDARGVACGDGWTLGHVRLAIVDLDRRSDQPFRVGGVVLSFNGEVWNHGELRAKLRAEGGVDFATPGDTEVFARALDAWGEAALEEVNGTFAVAWASPDGSVRLARDRFGEVPLHLAPLRGGGWAFSSELRALPRDSRRLARWVGPGEVVVLRPGASPAARRWHEPRIDPSGERTVEEGGRVARELLARGCRERLMSDVPVCTLLSGGVDSSAIAALLRRDVPDLVAFTAVMDPRSPDLRKARAVARHLSMPLVEVRVEPPTPDDLARVVSRVEMPHKAQVEIAWACEKLADAMQAEGFKVTFSGEGSDELWGAYSFAREAILRDGWHAARRDSFLGQHRKNFPRCNKVFMSRSIECRLPFLSPGLVEAALRLPIEAVRGAGATPERDSPRQRKSIMREAFADLLPPDVAGRARLAFQAGLGMRESAAECVSDPKRFYRAAFDEEFGGEP